MNPTVVDLPETNPEVATDIVPSISDLVGRNVLTRTVTHYHIGRVVAIDGGWLVLVDAAWIADTGRWAATLALGVEGLSEVEPWPDGEHVFVSLAAVIDICEWKHELPREVK